MKIALISDAHLGYGYGTEREEDAFAQFEAALDLAINRGADLIVLAGDVFDSRIPRPEVWARALKILQKPLLAKKSNVKFLGVAREREISPIVFSGIPVIAVHGTHEMRGSHAVNPVQTLEHAGFLIHLHCDCVSFEINGQRLNIFGLSGVPEQYVKGALESWDPKPAQGKNIFIFHQSLHEYIYDEGDTFISISDLPAGFDFYVDGHVHWNNVLAEKYFFPGSTVITQMKKREAEQKKGFYIIEDNKYEFVEIAQRPFYFEELHFEKADPADVVEAARAVAEKIVKAEKTKPLIKIKLEGSLKIGKKLDEGEITRDLNAIISIANEFEAGDFRSRIEKLRQMQQRKMSVEEMGLGLVHKLLAQTDYKGIPVEEILDALADGKNDEVIKKIMHCAP